MSNASATDPPAIQYRTSGRSAPTKHASPGHLLTVVHVTDLHLYFEDMRTQRRTMQAWLSEALASPAKHATRLAKWLSIRKGHTADRIALGHLERLLRTYAEHATDQRPVVVAQTGDVEAFGRDSENRWRGFDELHGQVWRRLEKPGVVFLDLFGNHDIWPPEMFRLDFGQKHREGPELLAQSAERVAGPYLADRLPVGRDQSTAVHIHRLNTVDPANIRGGIWARGKIGREPSVGDDQALNPADRLGVDTSREGIHLVLSHHPVKHIPSWLGVGRVTGANSLLARLSDDVLFLSGHLHKLHPEDPKSPTRQFVSTSPTVAKRRDDESNGDRSEDQEPHNRAPAHDDDDLPQLVAYEFAHTEAQLKMMRLRHHYYGPSREYGIEPRSEQLTLS